MNSGVSVGADQPIASEIDGADQEIDGADQEIDGADQEPMASEIEGADQEPAAYELDIEAAYELDPDAEHEIAVLEGVQGGGDGAQAADEPGVEQPERSPGGWVHLEDLVAMMPALHVMLQFPVVDVDHFLELQPYFENELQMTADNMFVRANPGCTVGSRPAHVS